MQRTLSPYVTAGVALAGAGIIAVTPAAPPGSSAIYPPVTLTSLEPVGAATLDDPFVTSSQFISNTEANLTGLQAEIAAQPSLLTEISANMGAYGEALTTASDNATAVLTTGLQGLPAVLDTAYSDFQAGDIIAGTEAVWNYESGGLTDAIHTLTAGVRPVLDSMASNADSVLTALGHSMNDILTSPLYALGSGEAAFAAVDQDITAALTAGDYTTAFTDMSEAPDSILNGFLNGIATGGSFNFTPYGLLTYDDGVYGPYGTIQDLLLAETNLADAVTEFTAPATTAAELSSQLSADLAGFASGLPTDLSSILLSLF